MSTLLERIEELVAGADGSARELDRRSDLSEGHTNVQIFRLRKQLSDPKKSADISLQTAMALAKGGRVSLEWLATGEGTRTGALPTEPVERAKLAARLLDYSAAAIEEGSKTKGDARAIFEAIVDAQARRMKRKKLKASDLPSGPQEDVALARVAEKADPKTGT